MVNWQVGRPWVSRGSRREWRKARGRTTCRVSLVRLADAAMDRSCIWGRTARHAGRAAERRSIGASLAAILLSSLGALRLGQRGSVGSGRGGRGGGLV